MCFENVWFHACVEKNIPWYHYHISKLGDSESQTKSQNPFEWKSKYRGIEVGKCFVSPIHLLLHFRLMKSTKSFMSTDIWPIILFELMKIWLSAFSQTNCTAIYLCMKLALLSTIKSELWTAMPCRYEYDDYLCPSSSQYTIHRLDLFNAQTFFRRHIFIMGRVVFSVIRNTIFTLNGLFDK